MINYNPKSWWGLIFRFHKSDTFRRLMPVMVSVILYSLGIIYLFREVVPELYRPQGTPTVHSLFGFVISLLLVFRTNTAYERWWEGRKLWGSLFNASRNLALKFSAFLPLNHSSRLLLAVQLASFPEVLKEHLRDQVRNPDPLIAHAPNAVAMKLWEEVERLRWRGDLKLPQLMTLHVDLTALIDICGGCERIKNTPIPYAYNLFIKKFIFIYIVTMPFALGPIFGYWSSLLTGFMLYVLGSLEMLAEEVENPFGQDANDLPTDELAERMGVNIREILLAGDGRQGLTVS